MVDPKFFGLLGRNISYSLSPLIFNSVFSKRQLPHSYGTFDIRQGELNRFVDSVRLLNIAGFNITIPYKEKIIQLIDKLDDTAKAVGAVNLVVNDNGKLTGYNTDIYGIKKTIESHLGTHLRGNNVALIGAGGSSKAVLHYLHSASPESVLVFNRTAKRAKAVINGHSNGLNVERYPLSRLRETIASRRPAMIINATPAPTGSLLDLGSLPARLRIFDLAYRPGTNAYPRSRTRCDGKFMLAAQASRGLQLLCGIRESAEELYKLIQKR